MAGCAREVRNAGGPRHRDRAGLRWQKLLDGHRFASILELADALAVDRSYVRSILLLSTLAPDIVEAIIEGRELSGLSQKRLTKGLPQAWGTSGSGSGLEPALGAR